MRCARVPTRSRDLRDAAFPSHFQFVMVAKVDGYLAPGPASIGWAPGSAPSAFDRGRLSPQWTAILLGSLGGGRRREATLQRHGFGFCRYLRFSGLALGFVGRPLWSRLGTSRLGRRGFHPCQTTFPMNWHVCVIPWGSRQRGAV